MKKLLVFKKKSAEDNVNHLIAVLRKKDSGEFELESRLDDTEISQSYSIPILSKAGSDSEGKKNLRKWLNQFLPPLDNKPVMDILLKNNNMTEYDEWEWLKLFRPESKQIISFSENFPENYLRHDLGLPYIDDDDAEIFFTNQEVKLDTIPFYEDIDDLDSEDCFFEDNEDGEECDDEEDNEDKKDDSAVRSDSFELFDDNTSSDIYGNNPRERSKINLKKFTELQEKELVTDSTTIRKTFEALADVPLKRYFNLIKNPMRQFEELSKLSNIAVDELKSSTINDVIKAFASNVKANAKVPDNYHTIGKVYNIISMPIGEAIINKPIRI